jgi:hypothetical protein
LPNLDPWVNQNENMTTNTVNKFENHLLSMKDEHQNQTRPNLHHPTYNERHEKIIEMIDWALEKYKETAAHIKKNQQKEEEEEEEEAIIIDNLIEELDNKRDIAINKKKQALLRDEVSIYRLEECTIDYVLFRICELTGRLY